MVGRNITLYYILFTLFCFILVIKISGKQGLRMSPFRFLYYEPVEFVSEEEFQSFTVGIPLS